MKRSLLRRSCACLLFAGAVVGCIPVSSEAGWFSITRRWKGLPANSYVYGGHHPYQTYYHGTYQMYAPLLNWGRYPYGMHGAAGACCGDPIYGHGGYMAPTHGGVPGW